MKHIFNQSLDYCLKSFKNDEQFNLTFSGEDTQFIRLNNSKVRQSSFVTQATVTVELIKGNKKTNMSVSLSADNVRNEFLLKDLVTELKDEIDNLPVHPFVVEPHVSEQSEEVHSGKLPSVDEFYDILQSELQGIDLAGYLTTGTSCRGSANSKGANHWFSAPSFFFDYSLYTAKEKAVKGVYAGSHFDRAEFKNNLNNNVSALELMTKENIVLKPGKYRVYLAPAATAELTGILQWGAFSAGSYKREQSPLKDLKDQKISWSDKVTMEEDFSLGYVPRFNELGEMTSEKLSLVKSGQLKQLLTSSQTAKEFDLTSNFANGSESPRSLHVHKGSLKEEEIFEKIGTGLYISNLHYLNWSDLIGARVTGMTRFGCLWVEKGKPVGPIKDMRFDETLHHIFGKGLVELSDKSESFLSTSTYFERNIGGVKVPGMLIDDFSLTL